MQVSYQRHNFGIATILIPIIYIIYHSLCLSDSLEAQYHHLELDAGFYGKPVEVTEEGGHMGEFG